MSDPVVIGVDFGTLSGRAVVVRVSDAAELGSAVHPYAHSVMDRTLTATGAALPPDWALQVPSDYVDVLRTAVPEALAASGVSPQDVIGLGTDFTACTMVPVLADGTLSSWWIKIVTGALLFVFIALQRLIARRAR